MQTGTNLQGKVKFTACINIAKTYARICVVDNDTYNNQACQDNYHTGNLNWTAYSWVLDCLGVYRKWASSAPMIEYTATDGEQDIWAGQGPWYGPYTC